MDQPRTKAAQDPPRVVPAAGRPDPWQRLEERIRPVYPKPGKGRRPLPVMLRIHCVQLFYNLSAPGMEDLLYEAESVRRFVGLSLSEALPDETTILNFRHLLERHGLGKGLFEEINAHLESQGLWLREGTIVDASIIEAPSSTKNRAGERDPEMQDEEREPVAFRDEGAHRGGFSSPQPERHGSQCLRGARPLHGGETQVWCDAGYSGSPQAGGEHWHGDAARPWESGSLGGEAQGIGEGRGAPVLESEAGVLKLRYRGRRRTGSVWRCFLNLVTAEGRLAG